MNKKDIRYVMTIIRPAIWALFYRCPLKMVKYTKVYFKFNVLEYGWFEIIDLDNDDGGYFEVKLKDGRVTHLEWIEKTL